MPLLIIRRWYHAPYYSCQDATQEKNDETDYDSNARSYVEASYRTLKRKPREGALDCMVSVNAKATNKLLRQHLGVSEIR